MKPIRVVAFNTMKEIIRDRILLGLVVFGVLLIAVAILLGDLSFAEQERIITNLGLVAIQLGCVMLAIFVGSSLVWREIEKQTVLLLISKPVKRSHFLMGKFLGLALVLILMDILMSLFLAGVFTFFGNLHVAPFVQAQVGVILESLVMLAITIFFGVFARPILTAIFSLALWLIGHGVNDLSYFAEKSNSVLVRNLGAASSRVLPNLDYFSFKEAAVYGDPIVWAGLGRAFFVAGAWVIILFMTSAWIFNRRDFV